MKNYLLPIAIALVFCTSAFGQTAGPNAAGTTAQSKPAPEPSFPRERFDPTRDPKADLAAAMDKAAKTGKNVVLDVGGEWCGWCVYMDKFFYQNPDIAGLRDKNYVWVKVNFSKVNENKEFLSAYPEPAGYPHLFVLDSSGKLLQSQDTSELEMGKGYNPDKVTEFLKKWSPGPAAPEKEAQPAK